MTNISSTPAKPPKARNGKRSVPVTLIILITLGIAVSIAAAMTVLYYHDSVVINGSVSLSWLIPGNIEGDRISFFHLTNEKDIERVQEILSSDWEYEDELWVKLYKLPLPEALHTRIQKGRYSQRVPTGTVLIAYWDKGYGWFLLKEIKTDTELNLNKENIRFD